MLAARTLGLTWPQFWDGVPAAVLDALLTAAVHTQQMEQAVLFGKPELAEGHNVKRARTLYLKTYAALLERLEPPAT